MARGSARKVTRADGSVIWYPRWDEGRDPATGKRVQREGKAAFGSRQEAVNYAEDRLYELRHGTYVRPSEETLGAYLERWLDGKALEEIKGHTIFGYRTALKNRLKTIWHLPLTDLTAARLHAVYLAERKKGISAGTLRNAHIPLKQALDQAVRHGELPRNVARDVKVPAYTSPKKAIWTADDARRFLAHVMTHPEATIWAVALATGMRLGELLALRWGDIDLAAATIHIQRTVTRDAEGITTEGSPKGNRNRVMPLPAAVVDLLQAHRDRQRWQRDKLGAHWVDEDRVFPREDGTRWPHYAAARAFTACCTAARVAHVTPHAQRHYAGTRAMLAGVPAAVVKEWLGHASVSTTIDLYGHPDEGDLRDASEVLWSEISGIRGEIVGKPGETG